MEAGQVHLKNSAGYRLNEIYQQYHCKNSNFNTSIIINVNITAKNI
jgi:hypothetical protein